MSANKEEILIDYLDNRLEGEERLSAEQLIREDPAAAQELAEFEFSVELIREAALLEQVIGVRKEFNTAKVIPLQKKESGVVKGSFSRNALRIAASVLFLVGAASVYKYSVTSTASVYEQQFSSFELGASRGNNHEGELETAYRNKNWTAVENIFTAQKEKTTKSWFLAGMADMELKNYAVAILSFQEVIKLNRNNPAPSYQDEAEYYLAMSWLAAKQPVPAVAMLRKIRQDKEHLFYKKASAMSALDLQLLELKH